MSQWRQVAVSARTLLPPAAMLVAAQVRAEAVAAVVALQLAPWAAIK